MLLVPEDSPGGCFGLVLPSGTPWQPQYVVEEIRTVDGKQKETGYNVVVRTRPH